MKKLNYTTPKVFDCQKMPQAIRAAFFSFVRDSGPLINRVYVDWHTQMWSGEAAEVAGETAMSPEDATLFTTVNNWLISQGMESDEDVIIKHHW